MPPKLIGRVDERVVAVAELPVKVASVPSVPLSNIDVPSAASMSPVTLPAIAAVTELNETSSEVPTAWPMAI